MGPLSSTDCVIADELAHELTTIQLDGARGLDALMLPIRDFLQLEAFLVFAPAPRLSGWGIERLESDNLPNASRFASTLAACLAHAPRNFWCFDACAPESEQRDCVIETIAHAGVEAYRASSVYREVLRPLRADLGFELRALVCEGSRLLAWVGGFQEAPIRPEQRDRLAALLPALRRRLGAERVLRSQKLASATLATVLEEIADAAFVLGPHGEVETLNNAARAMLQADARETIAALGSPGTANGRIDRVQVPGTVYTLTILRRVAGEWCDGRVQRAANTWRLTPRQREVLQLVIRGRGNASIAEELQIGERTVELHVSAILDRACVNSRTSLVALVFGALVLG